MNDKKDSILENIFDIIISSVKLGISYGRDLWDSISVVWKDDHLTPRQEEDFIWNGGVTNEGGSRIDDDENTPTPYDDTIIYDGIMENIEE